MPVSALMAAGALVLAAPLAASPASAAGDGHDGQVKATQSASEAVRLSQTRTSGAKVTIKVGSKLTATGTAHARATRKATGHGRATVTRWAATAEAAQQAAEKAAEDQALHLAKVHAKRAAGKAAGRAGHQQARKLALRHARENAKNAFGSKVVREASLQKGKPYHWGGNGPNSFDCSGLVRYVMKKAGVNGLPRTSSGIASKTHRVSKSAEKPGDVIIFSSGGHVYHVGIYAGGGKIWHAPGSGRSVTKVSIWTGSYSVGRLSA